MLAVWSYLYAWNVTASPGGGGLVAQAQFEVVRGAW